MSDSQLSIRSRTSSTAANYTELTVEQLNKQIESLSKENKMLTMENYVLENYLKRNDPTSSQSLEEAIQEKDQIGATKKSKSRLSQKSSGSSKSILNSSVKSAATGTITPLRVTGKISTQQRIDLTQKEIEECDMDLDKFMLHHEKKRKYYKAIMEETALRTHEIRDAKENLEKMVVDSQIIGLAGRVPGEKLLRFMDEWLRQADSLLGKLRLRKSHLLIVHKKVKINLAQKEELGETVHPIDFDQIRIENGHLLKKIEDKTDQLLELKKIAAQAALVLNVQRKFLFEQQRHYKTLCEKEKERQMEIKKLENDKIVVKNELEKALAKFNKITYLSENYQVPNTLDYVKKLTELKELKQMSKVWNRKRKIQQVGLASAKTRMKKLTGSVKDYHLLTEPQRRITADKGDTEKLMDKIEQFFTED